MSEAEKEVNVDIEHAMLDIPAHAVEIEINARVYLNGRLYRNNPQCKRVFTLVEV